jgi:hypothetical protein
MRSSCQTWTNSKLSKVLTFVLFSLCELLRLEPHRVFSITLTLLSFYRYSDPFRDFLFFLPQMENKRPPRLSVCSNNLLAETFWVFNNPTEFLQWILLLNPELKEFSSFLLRLSMHSSSTPSWRSTRSMPARQSLPESSTILFLFKTHSRVLFLSTSRARSMPTRQSSTEPTARFLSATVSSPTQPTS